MHFIESLANCNINRVKVSKSLASSAFMHMALYNSL